MSGALHAHPYRRGRTERTAFRACSVRALREEALDAPGPRGLGRRHGLLDTASGVSDERAYARGASLSAPHLTPHKPPGERT